MHIHKVRLFLHKASVSNLFTDGGAMTGDINTSHYVNWVNQYGCKWAHGALITGDMYYKVYSHTCYFQNRRFSNFTISTFGIGCTPTYPLQISTYATSAQTYKFLNYNGVGGHGSYNQTCSIYCSYTTAASE